MATVNKNFRIKHGLIVEGATGTINGQNILTQTGSDQYILDLVGGANLIDSVASGLSVVSSELSIDRTVVDTWYDASGSAATAQSAAEDYADGLAVNYDPAGSAATAQGNAEDYADGLAVNYDPAGSAATAQSNAEDYADGLAVNYDPAGSASAAQSAAATDATNKANAAQSAAEDYADGLAVNYDAVGSASAAQSAAQSYADGLISTEVTNRNTAISNAVDSLVDGAPALLNTLNELAAAINDDSNYTTTITTALGTKAPLASPDLTGVPTAPTAAADTNTTQIATTAFAKAEADSAQSAAEDYADGLAVNYDPAGSAATAQSNAEDYADGLAVNYDPAGSAATAQSNAEDYADGLAGDILDGTSAFTAINVNSVSLQKAVQSTIVTAQNGSSMLSWAKSDYGTAKAWVKFATATHSQISEVLLTTDSSNNIAITDFAEVGTNGSLGTITASYVAGNIAIEVNTVYANTTVTVVATLIK